MYPFAEGEKEQLHSKLILLDARTAAYSLGERGHLDWFLGEAKIASTPVYEPQSTRIQLPEHPASTMRQDSAERADDEALDGVIPQCIQTHRVDVVWREGGSRMVNIIWLFFIVISFIAAIVNGRMEALTEAAFEGAKSGVSVSFGLISVMVFWLGLMRVGEDAGCCAKSPSCCSQSVRFLFPGVPKDIQHLAI